MLNNNSTYKVTDQDIEAYDRDGVVCLRNILPQADVERIRDASLAAMQQGAPGMNGANDVPGGPRYYMTAFLTHFQPVFRDFALKSVLPSVAGQIMRAQDVRFFYDQLFIKEPGTQSPTDWHNDLPFWPLRGNDIVSLWVALTPVDSKSSGVEYVAGSHRWGKMYQAITPDRDPAYLDPALTPAPNYSDPAQRTGEQILSWSMNPGDVLAHHPLVVHGASGNASLTQTRVGLSLRYLGNDVQWDPRAYVMPLPVQPDVPPGAYPGDDRAFPPA
tara:strand:+ start:2430 stop:3248 length:819 start_codon:yes stop_codon:yes gene_type:complete